MKGVLLVNMGSPSSQKDMKAFLLKMFRDPAIMPFPSFLRYFLANLISRLRYKKSWGKYELIGGSPLRKSMDLTRDALNKKLGNNYIVYNSYSYDLPGIADGIKHLCYNGADRIVVIPMYPQYSISTTGSVEKVIKKVRKQFPDIGINVVREFYGNKNFLNFWKTIIKDTFIKNDLKQPLLLFSAHSVPEYQCRKDDYVKNIESSALFISLGTGMEFKVSYQSGTGKMKWVGPSTKETLKILAERKCEEIIIIPVSFINENLETRYDLDFDIIPFAKEQLNIKHIYKAAIPDAHPLMIELLEDIIKCNINEKSP